MNEISQDKDWYKIDLHIHTPASKCYKSQYDEKLEYLGIISKAVDENIRIIAITDHNSINGYKRLLNIKETMIKERESFLQITDSKQAKKKIAEIEKILVLFDSLLILPGVELDVNHGVHMLIIFNPTTAICEIEELIEAAGFSNDINADNDNLSKIGIFDLYEKSKDYDCFCIDAHTDSEKGMFSTLKHKTRGAAFQNDRLIAVSYRREETKKDIENLIQNKEFRRTKQLGFVRFSDSHCIADVAKYYTWSKLSKIDFSSLTIALSNPLECISIVKPEVAEILNSLINDSNPIFVEKIEDIASISKAVAALANSGGGYCLVGVDEKKTRKGIYYEPSDENLQELTDNLSKDLKINDEFIVHFSKYELPGKKCILSINVPAVQGIVYFGKDELVFTHNKNTVRRASMNFVESRIEDKILKEVEKQLLPRLEKIETNLFYVKTSFDTRRLSSYLKSKLTELYSYIEFEFIDIQMGSNNKDYAQAFINKEKYFNGISTGNVIIVHDDMNQRLPYAYLRISPPVYDQLNNIKPDIKKDSILITPTSSVFLINQDSIVISAKEMQCLAITIRKEFPEQTLLLYFIAMFLKSSFLFWYLLSHLDTMELYEMHIFNQIKVPYLNSNNPETLAHMKIIKNKTDYIYMREKEFLDETNSKTDNGLKSDEYQQLAEKYNADVQDSFYSIDKEIYDILHLNYNSIDLIENSLRRFDVYVPQFDKINHD
jgi:hypothetical protein